MSTITYTVPDSSFDDGEVADGEDIITTRDDIKDFLEGGNLDATDNIDVTGTFPWTGKHNWTISDAADDNLSLVVSAVMAAAKYGFHLSSSVAQINSALLYAELSNASSSVAVIQINQVGSGHGFLSTTTSSGSAFYGLNTSASNAVGVFQAQQDGTGPIVGGSLRALSGLNAVLLAKKQTNVYTVTNSATETVDTDLTVTLPANFLKAGTTIRGKVFGLITTPGAGPATVELFVKYGGTAGTILLDSGAITPTISLTNAPVWVDFMLTCLTTGGTGTIEAQGMVMLNPSGALSATVGPANRGMGTAGTGIGNTAAITIDTTVQKDLIFSFKMGSAVVGSTLTFRSGYIEILT